MIQGILLFHLAAAYIPPTAFIVQKISDRHKTYQSLQVMSTISEMDDGVVSGTHFREITWIDLARGMLWSRAYDDDYKLLYSKRRRLVGNLETAPTTIPPNPLADFLLFERNPDAIGRALLRVQIPILLEKDLAVMKTEAERRAAERTFLQRQETNVIIGVGDQASNGPKLFVEKNNFLPIRVHLPKSGANEIQFEDYHWVKSFPYPKMIWLNERSEDPGEAPKKLLVSELFKMQPNTGKFPKDLNTVRDGWTERGESASGSVRELIQLYYKFLR